MECRLTTQAERNNAAVLAGQKDIMCKMDTMCLEAENKSPPPPVNALLV